MINLDPVHLMSVKCLTRVKTKIITKIEDHLAIQDNTITKHNEEDFEGISQEIHLMNDHNNIKIKIIDHNNFKIRVIHNNNHQDSSEASQEELGIATNVEEYITFRADAQHKDKPAQIAEGSDTSDPSADHHEISKLDNRDTQLVGINNRLSASSKRIKYP